MKFPKNTKKFAKYFFFPDDKVTTRTAKCSRLKKFMFVMKIFSCEKMAEINESLAFDSKLFNETSFIFLKNQF